MQDQHGAATEALLPGLWAPPCPKSATDQALSAQPQCDRLTARRSVGTRPPLVTATYGGLLKQPDKQESRSVYESRRAKRLGRITPAADI